MIITIYQYGGDQIAQNNAFGRKTMIIERIFAIEKVGLANRKRNFI